MIGIGIDTGGTCTDAVAYDPDKKIVLACGKANTTHEKLEIGIHNALMTLPRELINQATYIALSTTLATNACVENKGGRVCLIFIGVKRSTVEDTYQSYGFDGMDFMRFLDGDARKKQEPDWNRLEEMLPEILDSYDSIAIAQMMPRENNGEYETQARDIILRKKQIPIVCAYEIFKDLNVIKRGAGALLNARLIPVIEQFFDAVRNVLREDKINLPFVIMRSDGSLVSEQYSRQYPIETLLCGPTASVKGGIELLGQNQAVIIDMGGTTSDIALVKDGEPVIDLDGVKVGGWKTFVRGIAIDTFGLGGDSQVCYDRNKLFLESRRVMPVTSLAEQYPGVLNELKNLDGEIYGNTKPLYEHLILMRDISSTSSHYSQKEMEICAALAEGPMSERQLAKILHTDIYMLHTERLEDEGVLLRSGFTPTDAMVLKGDFKRPSEAAHLAAAYIEKSLHHEVRDVAGEVYRLVKEKLFVNLVRILWQDAHGGIGSDYPEQLMELAKDAFAAEQNPAGTAFLKNMFLTNAALIGVGAPTHVFLPDVAAALHTEGLLSEYSGVSNALGALLGDVCVYETVTVEVNYVISNWDAEREDYIVYGDQKETFSTMEEALAYAGEQAKIRAQKKALQCGAKRIYSLTGQTKRREASTNLGKMLLGAEATACARGKLY